jgi:hypothetical protein
MCIVSPVAFRARRVAARVAPGVTDAAWKAVKQEVEMRLNDRRVIASVMCPALAALLFAAAVVAQSDPAVGTWKLNPEKSRYSPGPAPKSNVITIVAAGDTLKISSKGTDASDKPTTTSYTATFDGKDGPITGNPAYDTVSHKRIDANTTEQTRKKEGKTVQTAVRKISADGKTMTVTSRGETATGRTLNNVAVYERQQASR